MTTYDCAGAVYSPSNEDGNTITDPNGATCRNSSVDGLGFCCGDAITTDCAGNYYSPSNEDGNTTTDPNGVSCRNSSVDGLGYCCGDATTDCAGIWYSPSNEDGNTINDGYHAPCNLASVDRFGYCCGECNDPKWYAEIPYFGGCQIFDGYCSFPEYAAYTDPNGNVCAYFCPILDALGYCWGDAGPGPNSYTGSFPVTDCAGAVYSPSNEDGNTTTDPNGATCRNSSVDRLGYCCGDATLDCNGNYYSPSNEDGGVYTFVQMGFGQPTGVVCSNASAFPQNVGGGYNGACVCFNQADCAGTVITPENRWIDGNAGVCASSSAGCFGYCCQFDMGGDCALTSDPCNYGGHYDCQGTPCGSAVSGSYGNCLGVPVFPDPSQVRSGVDFGFNASQTGTLVATAARPSVNIGALIGLPPFIQL